jgi:DNA-binding SARP family transcriptional activator
MSTVAPAAQRPYTTRALTLLGGIRLEVGGEVVVLALSAQRLLAFLAVRNHPMPRTQVAGSLWPDASDDHAAGCLRSALWRTKVAGVVVEASKRDLRLHADVVVDLHAGIRIARSLIGSEAVDLEGIDAVALSEDLLPDWSDEWVTVERERFRQLRLHALEALCEGQTRDARFAQAVNAGISAVAGEPLRESAHCMLIKAYLAEGNIAQAIGQYQRYRDLLRTELDLEPSQAIMTLIPRGGAVSERGGA